MSLFARSLRLVASMSSAGDGVLFRDTHLPGGAALRRPGPRRELLRRRLERLTALRRDPSDAHDGLERAAAAMSEMFAEVGLEVEADRFVVDGRSVSNVLGHLPYRPTNGSEPPPRAKCRVVVMGHYDAVPETAGADDNASGAVGLVEIASRLDTRQTRSPITFLASTLEEYGMHGSLRQARTARDRGVAAVIDLEMIAYTSRRQALPRGISARRRGDFIAIVANEPSAFIGRAFVEAARETAIDLPVELIILRGRGTDLPISRLSDHAPFWDAGVPAVMVTDTAFLRNPNYHAPTDTLDTLDLDFMSRVCDLVAETAARL